MTELAKFTARTIHQPRAESVALPDDWDAALESARKMAKKTGKVVEVRDNDQAETMNVYPDCSLSRWADDYPMTHKEKVAEALDEIEDA
jgi:hypothetical protein